MLVITLDGTKYEFDSSRLMMSEAIALKKVSGLSPERLFDGMRSRTCDAEQCDGWVDGNPCDVDEHKRDTDPECFKALVWLAVRRAEGNDAPRFSDFDFNFAAVDIEEIPDEVEDGDDDGLDPTTPAVTSKPSSTRTRRSSRTSSGSTPGTSRG